MPADVDMAQFRCELGRVRGERPYRLQIIALDVRFMPRIEINRIKEAIPPYCFFPRCRHG